MRELEQLNAMRLQRYETLLGMTQLDELYWDDTQDAITFEPETDYWKRERLDVVYRLPVAANRRRQ